MSKSAFDQIELPEDFEPMGVFMEGKKDKDGAALVSATDILEGKVNKGGGTDSEEDDDLDEDQELELAKQRKLDEMLNLDDDEDDDLENDDDLDDPKSSKNKANAGDKNPTDDENPLKAFYGLMVKEGLWEEEEEEFDGSEEKFLEIKEKNIERMREEDINEYLEKAFEKNPDGKTYGKALLSHLAAGGSIRDFVEVNEAADITEDDLDNEETGESAAETLSRNYLKLIGWEADEIKDFIKNKKDKGQLVDYAKEHIKPYQKQVARINEDNIKARKDAELERKKTAIQYTTKVNEIISTVEKVGTTELPKTPKEKKALLAYMLQPIETEDGRQMPQFTADYIKLSKDPEFNVFLATALQSWNAKGGKKSNTQSSTTDTVRTLLSRKNKQDDNTGKDRQRAPQPKKGNTSKNWSF